MEEIPLILVEPTARLVIEIRLGPSHPPRRDIQVALGPV
jgi:hypothetical protein